MKKQSKQQPSGKPKEAPRESELQKTKVLWGHITEMLMLSKSIALETRASLEQTTSVLASVTERLEEMRRENTARILTEDLVNEIARKADLALHNVSVLRDDPPGSVSGMAVLARYPDLQDMIHRVEMNIEAQIEAYLKSHVEEVRDWLRIDDLVKQYLQENPEWLRRPADQVTEAKMCGARYKGATCELRLGHTEWHGDRTAVKYWPLETSDAPESFPGPKAGI